MCCNLLFTSEGDRIAASDVFSQQTAADQTVTLSKEGDINYRWEQVVREDSLPSIRPSHHLFFGCFSSSKSNVIDQVRDLQSLHQDLSSPRPKGSHPRNPQQEVVSLDSSNCHLENIG